jgi:predicted  nucleic acid-binding Zn-ribbon protein
MAGQLLVCAFATSLLAVSGTVITSEQKVSPIEKVLQMLVELQENVIAEGRKEAKTYDKFACFCKDAAEEKSESITDKQDEVDDLVGKITALNSDRNECDNKLSELNKEIGVINQEMAAANKRNIEEKTQFEADRKEVTDAENGIHEATEFIKKGSAGELALAQGAKMPNTLVKKMRKTAKDVKAAVHLADHLGLWEPEHHKLLMAFAQFEEHDPMVPEADNYGGHSDAQLATMTNLEKDFHGNVEQKDANERKRVAAFQGFMQQKFDEKKAKEKQTAKQERLKTKKVGEIGARTKELSETQATLHDDQNYLKDLIEKCNAKSDEWDQRTNMRKAELAALTTAVDIISKRVAAQAGKTNLKRFLQLSAEADEAASEDVPVTRKTQRVHEKEPRAGLQLSHASFSHLASPKRQLGLIAKKITVPVAKDGDSYDFTPVLALLRTKGKELKSTMLLKLAEKVEADPFAKIKQLIQELIGRLSQEAADEATHKGWCDKELAKATVMRDDTASAIAQLNSLLDAHQASAQKLSDDIQALESQISELEDTQEKFTKARDDEKAENEKNIQEAQDGLVAINDAVKVLKDFYGAAKEGGEAPELLQDPAKADDMPDSGFEGDNTGSQEAASGILGMMDVIVSDFERTIKVTGEEEDEATRDFTELNRKTQLSIDTKTEGKNAKQSELTDTTAKITQELDDLTNEQGILDGAITELLELQPACIDTGMSYEDRVAKREQELESLKQALCLLEREGPVKEESMSADC